MNVIRILNANMQVHLHVSIFFLQAEKCFACICICGTILFVKVGKLTLI